MLNIKSVAYHTLGGATAGGLLGYAFEQATIDSTSTALFLGLFVQGYEESNMLAAIDTYDFCTSKWRTSCAITGSIIGGSLGLLAGITIEVFKNYRSGNSQNETIRSTANKPDLQLLDVSTTASSQEINAQDNHPGMDISIISQEEKKHLGFPTATAISKINPETLITVDSDSESL